MKIAMVTMDAGPLAWLGGIDGRDRSVVVDCLSDALARSGHDVTQHASCAPNQPAAVDEIEAFAARLCAQWAGQRPDVVHAHSWMAGQAAAATARRFDLPVIQTFHGVARAERGLLRLPRPDHGPRSAAEAALARSCDRIIATSSAEVFELLGIGASPGAIKLIPCGVDLGLFGPAVTPVERGGAFRVVTLGRLTADSGVGDVIEALRHVKNVELVVGGGLHGAPDVLADPGVAQFAALARAHGVDSRIAFRGRIKRDEVAAFLRSADAVVCAPWHDSTGTVALEAMACGIPVIVSAVGALVDAVADGMTGIHVPPRAPRQLAYAMETLKNGAALRQRLGRFGVERASARYGWERIAAETAAVYASVAGRGAGATKSCS